MPACGGAHRARRESAGQRQTAQGRSHQLRGAGEVDDPREGGNRVVGGHHDGAAGSELDLPREAAPVGCGADRARGRPGDR